ncbi:hypothetical protein ACYPKM_05010 [Pseudomonas aeruginosa]
MSGLAAAFANQNILVFTILMFFMGMGYLMKKHPRFGLVVRHLLLACLTSFIVVLSPVIYLFRRHEILDEHGSYLAFVTKTVRGLYANASD